MTMLQSLRSLRLLAVFAFVLPLAACAGDDGPSASPPPKGEFSEVPPEQIYSGALIQLDKGNWPTEP